MITAIGIELSQDTETCAVAVASRAEGARKYDVNLIYYGASDGAVAAAAGVYAGTECAGTWCDPMAAAGLLDDLRGAGIWLYLLTAVEVASASYLFKSMVRRHRVRTAGHEALRASMQYAMPRRLATAFAFERRKTSADAAPLNAACFALYGLRKNEVGDEVGVWILDTGEAPGLPGAAAGTVHGPGMSQPVPAAAAAARGTMEAGERYQGPPLGWPIEDR